MRPRQWKIALGVLEGRRLEAVWRVTSCAILFELALVIISVTIGARSYYGLVPDGLTFAAGERAVFQLVAFLAIDFGVHANEWKGCISVIELHAGWSVATFAVCAQLA